MRTVVTSAARAAALPHRSAAATHAASAIALPFMLASLSVFALPAALYSARAAGQQRVV